MAKVTYLNKRNKKKEGISKKLFLFIFLLIIVFLIFFKLSEIKFIQIEGNKRYTDQQITTIIDVDNNKNILYLFMDKKLNTKDFPYIEDIKIKYTDFNSILVTVIEKKVVGYLPYMNKYLCIDNEGYVIDYTEKLFEDVPIIEGIEIDTFALSEKLTIEQHIIDAFLIFFHGEEKYDLDIDTINIVTNDMEYITMEINGIKIIFGTMDNANKKLALMSEIIKSISDEERGTIDLRGNLNKIVLKKVTD